MNWKLSALAALFLVKVASATPSQLIQNGGFENSWTGWQAGSDIVNPFASPFDGTEIAVANSNSGAPAWALRNTAPHGWQGTQPWVGTGTSAFNGFDGSGGAFFLHQQFAVSGTVTSANLSFDWGSESFLSGFGATIPRDIEVNIYDPLGGGVGVFSFNTGLGDSPWITHFESLDVTSAFAAGAGLYDLTFYLHVPQNFTGPALFGIDNISLTAQLPEASLSDLIKAF